MPAETQGSWRLIREAATDRTRLIGRKCGRNEALVTKWMRPPPSMAHPEASGVSNPIDILVEFCRCIEDPEPILSFVAAQFGYSLRKAETENPSTGGE